MKRNHSGARFLRTHTGEVCEGIFYGRHTILEQGKSVKGKKQQRQWMRNRLKPPFPVPWAAWGKEGKK